MFNGFSDATTDFLWNISFNYERPWLNENKQEYLDNLWNPFKTLANEVYDLFTDEYKDLYVNLHVSRIYRDARRLHGRGPYKDHLWFSIRPDHEYWHERPVFWFEIAPEGYSFGLGVYAPNPAQMERFRREVDAGAPELIRLAEEFEKQDWFVLEGAEYARKTGDPPAPLNKWYNRKSLNLACNRGHDEKYYSGELVAEVVKGFSMLEPYYRYFDSLASRAMEESEEKAEPKKDKFDF